MQHEDRVRLQHMLDASQEALAFAENHERNDLYRDRMLLLALVKLPARYQTTYVQMHRTFHGPTSWPCATD